jgi:YggT family protein
MSIKYLLASLIDIYVIVIIIRVIVSWFSIPANRSFLLFYEFLYRLSDPLLNMVRRFMPGSATVDFSPVVAILILYLLKSVILFL